MANDLIKALLATGYKGSLRPKPNPSNNSEEFNRHVSEQASKFRNKKLREFLDKPREQRTDTEKSMIKQWSDKYGNRF